MAEPAAAVVDNFNRASLGATWSTYAAAGTGNAIAGSTQMSAGGASYTGSYYNAQDESRPCEVYATFTVPGALYAGLMLLDTPGTTASNDDGYKVGTAISPDNEYVLYRVDNGVDTELDAWGPGDFSNNKIALQVDATHVRAWQDTGTGWAEMAQFADTTYSGPWFPVVDIFDPGADEVRIDDLAFAAITAGGTAHDEFPADGFGLFDELDAELTIDHSQGDGLELTDARAFTVGKAVAETFSLTDARAFTQGKVVADGFGLTDSATPDHQSGSGGHTRNVNDTLGLTDATTTTWTVARGTADTLGLTDARSITQGKSVADGFALTDATTRVSGVSRTVADGFSLTDSVATSAAGSHSRNIGDGFGLTDTTTRTSGANRTQADGFGLTDTLTRAVQIARSSSDTLGLTDLQTTTWHASRTISDTLTLTDSFTSTGTITAASLSVADLRTGADVAFTDSSAADIATTDIAAGADVSVLDLVP